MLPSDAYTTTFKDGMTYGLTYNHGSFGRSRLTIYCMHVWSSVYFLNMCIVAILEQITITHHNSLAVSLLMASKCKSIPKSSLGVRGSTALRSRS